MRLFRGCFFICVFILFTTWTFRKKLGIKKLELIIRLTLTVQLIPGALALYRNQESFIINLLFLGSWLFFYIWLWRTPLTKFCPNCGDELVVKQKKLDS